MRTATYIMAATVAAATATVAAQGATADGPPKTLSEYRRTLQARPAPWPDYTVRQYNLRRVWNDDLAADERVASLDVVVHLAGNDEVVVEQLSMLLGQEKTPRELHDAVLALLLRKGTPEVAGHVVRALDNPKLPPDLRDAILRWLVDHPQPEVLARVVQLWADEPPDGANERRFVRIVERISGKRWDQALLDGINAERFFARGSALEVLSARMDEPVLRRRIVERKPATPAMAALHVFSQRFDYLPADGNEFVATTWLYTRNADQIPDAARLAKQWRRSGGYRFNIRDFHLLSRLARDPTRKGIRRSQLVVDVGRMLVAREHVMPSAYAGRPAAPRLRDFPDQVDRLSIADLWTLKLVGDMLARPRIQRALWIVARQDRADRRSAKGGLIVLESGRAEAKLFPADIEREQDDLHYVPSRYAARASRDALAWFAGHFDKLDNVERIAPDAEEFAAARAGNYRGVILTSLGEGQFTAHYYDCNGEVVSLGIYPFRQ